VMEKKEKEKRVPPSAVGGLRCFLFVGGLLRSLPSPPTALGGSLN
jgi:hypothetical protein